MSGHVRSFDANYSALIAANAGAVHAAARATSLSPPVYPVQSAVIEAQARADAAILTRDAVRASVSPTNHRYSPNVSAAQVNACWTATHAVCTSPKVVSPAPSACVAAENAATRAGSYHAHLANSAQLVGINTSARQTAEAGIAQAIADARVRVADDVVEEKKRIAAEAHARATTQAAVMSELATADANARAAAALNANAAVEAHARAVSNIAQGNANAAAAQAVHHGMYSGSPYVPRYC